MAENISSGRMTANVVGCVMLTIVCVPTCISLAWSLAGLPPPAPDDPDGAKAGAIYLFGAVTSGLIGVAAIASLIRGMRT